ncbi:MAG: hypothetical protein ACYSSM_04810 [Planctomycetota bacterium]|jgi:hypothetical protein
MSKTTKQFGDSGVWRGWRVLCGDVNWEDYGGKWGFKDPNNSSVFYVIRHDNMLECMGERDVEESGIDIHISQVCRVDLSEVPQSEIDSALESCGPDFDYWPEPVSVEDRNWAVAESLVDYGASAPMGEYSDPSYPERARAAARRAVEEMIADSDHTDRLLDRPVNAIGSTARDFGRGDIMAGLDRYNRAKEASSLSVPMGQVPSDDPLAYTFGYQHGATGQPLADAGDGDLAPAYIEGHALGVKVLAGEVSPPTWAKPAPSNPAMDLMAKLHN